MGALKPWHIAVLVVVLVLLFGSKKLPDAARGLGRSLRILKSETEEMRKGDDADKEPDAKNEKADAKHAREPMPPTIEGETSSSKSDKDREQA